MTPPLRALLLAAGFGTRLRPLTLQTPKCLVSVAGEPLLGRWLRQLEAVSCEAVLINTHYLSDQVEAFVAGRRYSSMQVHLVHEHELLGTAGTLLANRAFFNHATGLMIHADNAMADDLSALLSAHRQRPENCVLTMLTFSTQNPQSCGIVQTNADGVVIGFEEKVKHPSGNRANGAIYAFDASLFEALQRSGVDASDFSTQVIPCLLHRIYTCHTQQPFLDIGTPGALARAQHLLGDG